MWRCYLSALIWTGIFKRFSTKRRHAMLARGGYQVTDNSELNALLIMATKQSKENEHAIPQ